MTFLGFRHAKRKAKKMVNARPSRSPTPSSGSFVASSVVEIGDPSSTSAEACYTPVTLRVDVDITPDPPFLSDPHFPTFRYHSSSTYPRQLRDRVSRSGLSRSSHNPSHRDTGRVPQVSVFRISTVYGVLALYTENGFQDGRVARSAVVGDVIRVRLCRPSTQFLHLVTILRHQTPAVRLKPHPRQSLSRPCIMHPKCRFNDRLASLQSHLLLP
jgi:hypothetical protein